MDAAAAARAVVAEAQAGGRDKVGVIVLGRGEDEKRVHDWLTVGARTKGVIGFAVGRTNFTEPLKAHLAGDIDAKSAVETIADNYKGCVDIWKEAKG